MQAEKNFPITGKFSVGINVKGNLGASLSPVVATDWSIASNLVLTTQLEKATTRIPVIGEVDITGIIKAIVEKSLDGAKKAAQDKVEKALNVKADIEKIWNQINNFHQLSKSPPVWLRITPKKAAFGQLDYKSDSVATGLALELESHVFIQEKPPEVLKAPLPQLLRTATVPGEFNLSIPVEASYTAINNQLKTELTKHPLSLEGDVSVIVKDATVQPYGDGVLLILKFKGTKGYFKSASGTLYVSGIPAYDKDKAELRIDQLNYSAETKDILFKSVEWLAHSTLLDKMKAATIVKLDSEVKDAKKKANEELAGLKNRLPKEISADVSVADLVIERIVFVRERAFAIVKASGRLSARLQK